MIDKLIPRRSTAVEPANPGREAFARAQQVVMPTDPKVVVFMEQYAALERRADELQQACERYECDLQVASKRIEYLEGELYRLRLKHDAFQRGYLSMKVQVSVVANTAIAALEESKREFLKEGIDPNEQPPATVRVVEQNLQALEEQLTGKPEQQEG